MENNKTKKKVNIFQSNEILMLIVLAIVIAIFTGLNKNFFSITNFTNILMAASTIGLLAIGETYLIIAGHIDLASAHTASLFGVMMALLVNKNIPWGLAILIVVICSAIVGLCNSLLVNIFELQPFIATLAISQVCQGAAYLICDGKSQPVANQAYNQIGTMRIMGIPFPAIIMVIFLSFLVLFFPKRYLVVVYIWLEEIPEAARLAGLSPKRTSTILYLMSSMIAAFAGILMTAKMHSGQPAGGSGAEFDAITAAILGGVAFTGGKGNLLGCFIGLLVMQCFNNGLTVVNVSSFWQVVAKGLLLIGALVFDYVRRKKLVK